jgi:hypothetical protein
MIIYILYAIFTAIFLIAIKGELNDCKKINNLPNIENVDKKDRARHYKFLAKFPYENAANWRMLYISSILATLLLWFVFYMAGSDYMGMEMILIFFIIIFMCGYLGNKINDYRYYRVLASKADPNIAIL